MRSFFKAVILMSLILCISQVFAAFHATPSYGAYNFYPNLHAEEAIVSFDWTEDGFCYSTGRLDWDLGFKVYRYTYEVVDQKSIPMNPIPIYEDPASFAGSRVTAINGQIYFNDGGAYDRWDYRYFRYNPSISGFTSVIDLEIRSDLWGLETRQPNELWASGGYSASIYAGLLDAAGNLVYNPLINLGTIGNASGPLAFDQNGNLFYAEGYNAAGSVIYRWKASEVAAAVADPVRFPLNPAGHVWAVLETGDGSTSMVVDQAGNLIVTATSFDSPSRLYRLFSLNGAYVGCETLASSDERLETVRLSGNDITLSTSQGIYATWPITCFSFLAQQLGGALLKVAFHEDTNPLTLKTIASDTASWVVRDMYANRILLQAGSGGAVAIAELDAGSQVTNFVQLAKSVPGWNACALDGNRILAQQAGGNAMIGIQELGPNYSLGTFKVAAQSVPGWIARDLDGDRLLAQAGDGGMVVIAKLNSAGQPVKISTVVNAVPGWVVRSLAGNFLFAQAGKGGMSAIAVLDEHEGFANYYLTLAPVPGFDLIGLQIKGLLRGR